MRRFTLHRRTDRPGDDGERPTLGEGVHFGDGSAVVRWLHRSTEVWDRCDDPVEQMIERTYGGVVAVAWVDPPDPPGPPEGVGLLTLVRGVRDA